MSESITHTAVLDDALRLLHASGRFCEAFRRAAEEHHDMARLGSITRGGDGCNPGLLALYRDRAAEGPLDDATRAKLAFVIGWLCHRSADRQMKPLFRALDPDCPRSPTDCSVYHDVFLFREIYARGAEEPYDVRMFDTPPDTEAVENLFRLFLQRALVALHTFIPNMEDPDGWLDGLLKLRQRWRVDLRRYADALTNPDPDRVRRFIEDVNFYDADEPLIAAARALQLGRDVPADRLDAALDAQPASHYAQTLRQSYGYIRAADDCFTGRIDDAELARRLNIGKPGRDGKGV